LGKRRHPGHPSAAGESEPELPGFLVGRPWLGVIIAVVFLAVVGAAGYGLTLGVTPHPTGALAKCKTATEVGPHQYSGSPGMCIDLKNKYTATIETTKGKVGIQMIPDKAPVTVNNFVVLSVNGYYDGLTFWRVEDWVIQSGDPAGSGRGGPGYDLPAEGSSEAWVSGSVGMAKVPAGPTNGSQFFITKAPWPAPGPDSPYNRLGTVVSGQDIVGQLGKDDRIITITVKAS
jgi:cyclophilin family peptidyl-prolyl cis-trans isomerase